MTKRFKQMFYIDIYCLCFLLQPNDPEFSSQIMVYKDIGEEMLQHAFDGKCIRNEFTLVLHIETPENENVWRTRV